MTHGAEIRFGEAVEAYRAGNMPQALLALRAALQLEPTWPIKGHILHAGATIASELGERRDAHDWWVQFFREYKNQPFPALKLATSYYDAAYTYRLTGDISSAIAYYQTALEMFRRVEGGQQYIVRTLQNLAWALCSMTPSDADLAEARRLLDEAQPMVDGGEDHWHQVVGNAYWYAAQGRDEQAMLLVQSLFDQYADATVRAQACFVAATVHRSHHEYVAGAAWVRRMRELMAQSPRKADLAYDLRTLEIIEQEAAEAAQ